MLGLRAKLSPPPLGAVTIFMKTDGMKSKPNTLPHICLPNISLPTPMPLLQVLSISDNTPVDHLAHKTPTSLSLNVPLPHLVGKCKWIVPYVVGSKKNGSQRGRAVKSPSKDSIEMVLLTSFNLKEQFDNFIFKEVCANSKHTHSICFNRGGDSSSAWP